MYECASTRGRIGFRGTTCTESSEQHHLVLYSEGDPGRASTSPWRSAKDDRAGEDTDRGLRAPIQELPNKRNEDGCNGIQLDGMGWLGMERGPIAGQTDEQANGK